MKRILGIILSLIIVFSAFVEVGKSAELQPYAFPFTGRWNPTENPLLLDDYGLQDIQNLRKYGKHFKGVDGHTVINASSLSTYYYLLNGFHFKKDQPSESHVIVYAGDGFVPAAGRLYQNTTAIPSTGNFSATALHTPSEYNYLWRFSKAPAGNMIASNGDETLIFGGSELEATSVVTSSSTITYAVANSNDYSDILSNTRQSADQVATVSASGGNDAYTKLLLHMDGLDGGVTFTDSSATGHAVTPTNSTTSTTQFVYGTASGLFNGTNAYLTIPDSAEWILGTNAFTVDFRIRFTALPANGDFAGIWFDAQNVDNYVHCSLYNNAGTYYLYFQYRTGGGVVQTVLVAAWTPTLNQWYHVALIRGWGGAANSFAFAVDGSLVGAPATVAATLPDIAGSFYIGVTGANGHNEYLAGYLDEFRFTNGVARWTANFTPPTQSYGNPSNYFLIGSKRPLQGVKFYVSSGNTVASTLSVSEWQGTSWTALVVTDNTDTGATLATTGTVTWTATGNAKARYINGLSLFWYQFYFDAGQASLYYVTTDAPMTTIRNIWDGSEGYAVKVLKYDGTTYKDYSDETADSSQATYADLSSLQTTHALYVGFLDPQQGISFKFVSGSENATAATTMTLSYWTGSEWVAAPAQSDGTLTTTTSMSKGGVVAFQAPTPGTEFKRAISDETPLYYYRIQFAGNLDADTKVSEIRGISAPPTMSSFRFSDIFQGRTLLCNEPSGDKHKCIYSAYNAPDIFNGDDSGDLYFGDKTEVTGSAVLYNVFLSAGYDQQLVFKANETYRVYGDGPENWIIQRISGRIGCVAPLSIAVAEVMDISQDVKRNVAIWVSDKGVVMSDGATITSISEDIKVYWDANSSVYIPAAYANRAIGWYDPKLQSYKLLIVAGGKGSYLNTELEYSLKHKEWTKIVRENAAGENPLQSGFEVFDTAGIGYTYGGGKDGFMYRLENGNNWNSVADITSYLHTKDLILDNQTPLFRHSLAKYIRTTYKAKDVGNITITHYGDRTASVTGVSGQFAPSVIVSGSTNYYDTQSVNLGPFLYHSFKYSATTDTADGLELTGMGVYFQPVTTIR